jgi:tRNA(Ile)-lysidine synthase TilS/MesJ
MLFPYRERDLRVIRPFVYVREKSLRQFAESRNLPVIPENCPACFEAPKVSTIHCSTCMSVYGS